MRPPEFTNDEIQAFYRAMREGTPSVVLNCQTWNKDQRSALNRALEKMSLPSHDIADKHYAIEVPMQGIFLEEE